MVRRRRPLVTLVLAALVAVVAAACQPASVPIGARASGDRVEAFVGSCSGSPVTVQLFETDQPVPTTLQHATRSAPATGPVSGPATVGGSTPPGSYWTRGESVWRGDVPAGHASIVIPVTLDPSHTYTLTVVGGEDDPSFDDFTFVPAALSPDGVTSNAYRARNEPVTPEAHADRFDAACDAAAGGPLPWIFGIGIIVVFLCLAGFGLTVGLLIRAATERRPPRWPPAAPPPRARD